MGRSRKRVQSQREGRAPSLTHRAMPWAQGLAWGARAAPEQPQSSPSPKAVPALPAPAPAASPGRCKQIPGLLPRTFPSSGWPQKLSQTPPPLVLPFSKFPISQHQGDSHPKNPWNPPSGPAHGDSGINGNKDTNQELELCFSHIFDFAASLQGSHGTARPAQVGSAPLGAPGTGS